MSEPEPLSDLLKRIDALAEDATPGKWHAMYWDGQHRVGNGDVSVTGDLPRVPDKQQAGRNAAYIAALDPQTWLRVSAALREARAEVERLRRDADRDAGIDAGFPDLGPA